MGGTQSSLNRQLLYFFVHFANCLGCSIADRERLRCSCLEYALCRFRPLAPQRCYFDPTHLLVIDEKIFDLLQQNRR
jgi:hypothetical protein